MIFVTRTDDTLRTMQGQHRLTISPELQSVVPLPSSSPSCVSMVVQMALLDSTGLLPNRCQSTSLTVLHRTSTDPIDPRISPDGI